MEAAPFPGRSSASPHPRTVVSGAPWRGGHGRRSHGAGLTLAVAVARRACEIRARRRATISHQELEELLAASPWQKGLEPAVETEPTLVRGRIPKDLRGTIFRNSAGRLRVGTSKYEHWFDGDGFVSALAIDGAAQEAAFAGRFVRTPRFRAQQEPEALAQTQRGRGMAGVGAWTPAANGDLWANVFRIPTNPANTSILWWGDRLLALCEGGLPFRLDPGTLESLGEELFTDIPVSQSGVSFFSAHPKRDPSGEIFNIGLKLGVPPGLEVFRCSAGGQLLQRACVPTEGFSFVHDFAITEKYVVLILPPWSCSSAGVVQSLWDGPMARKFAWREELGTRCMLLRRDDLSVVFDEVLRPAVSLYHTVNAFDDGDVVRLQIAAHNGSREAVEKNFRDMYRAIWTPETSCSLKEVVLDVASGGIKIGPAGPKDAAPFELPNVHPDVVGRRHRHIFTNASSTAVGFSNTVERLDLEGQVVDQASFAEDQFAGEPLLLPKKRATPGDELDAYVCTCVYDVSAHKSFYAFLDADDLAAGAKAEVHLPTHVPYSFHGEWVPGRVDLLAAAKSKR